jgi:hypothetical protein
MLFGFYHPNIIPRSMEIISSSVWSFPHFPLHSSLLRVNIKLNTLVSVLTIYEKSVSLSNTVQSSRYLWTFRINLFDLSSDSENNNRGEGRKFLWRVGIYIYRTVRVISTFTDIITRHLTPSLLRHLHINLLLTITITIFVLSELGLAEVSEDFQASERNAMYSVITKTLV